jgi:Cephalosporin hydroxylase
MLLEYIRSHLSPSRRESLKRYFHDPKHRGLQHFIGRLLFRSNLRALAALYGSDKGGGHEYVQHYQRKLAPLRRKGIVLLEIGIGGYGTPESGGASLRMWRTYFPRGRIYGIDIHDKSPHDERRVKTFRGSQDDKTFLDRVISEIGQPDVIIDDGSHVCAHIIASFNSLFPKLREGGYYFVEDTQTSYLPDYGGSDSDPDDPRTSVGYFKQRVHGLNYEERQNSTEPSYFEKKITVISFFHNLICVEKGDNIEETNKDKLNAKPNNA